ncbi:MAG: sulfurtransferase [Thiobacillus sp.]|nr:sulfurtransferase [Thiobacillus sp.]
MSLRRLMPRLVLIALLGAGIVWAFVNRQRFDPDAIEAAVGSLGAWTSVAYIAVYVLATVLFLPGSIFTLAGGAIFGPVWGAVYALGAATVGATFAFLAARYIAADWVRDKVGGRIKQLIEGVEAEGWRFVAFTRLVPLFPFNLLNYALGLTRIGLLPYVVTSFICMAPGAVAYTYLGYAGREAVVGSEDAIQKGLIALGLLALVAFSPRLVRRIRAGGFTFITSDELYESLGKGDGPVAVDVRGDEEFGGELGHLQGALNIPVEDLSHRIGELDSFKGKSVVLICRTDKRSAKAAGILSKAGFRSVAVLRGGMVEWAQRGLPAEGRTTDLTKQEAPL